MKKIFLLSAIAISSFIYNTANAQIGVQFHINLGARPVYVEPAPAYDDDYYYLPDVAAYYSVSQHCYYYNDGDNWISAAYLPGRYHDYDWQHARRFAVHESRPYLHDDVYRSRYHGGFEGRPNWGNHDDHDNRVYADRDHRGYQNDNRYDNHGGYQQQRDDRDHNYGRGQQPQGGNRNQPQQPQHDDRGGQGGNNNSHAQQQQPQQPQHSDNRGGQGQGGNDRGNRGGRFS